MSMNSPMNSGCPTPGLKGVSGVYDPQTKATPGNLESPFKDGVPAFRAGTDIPEKFAENIPASPLEMNSPFKNR
jgi:hypothetical protein